MVVRLHPEALAELGEAIAFYEDRAPGLGRDLLDEVQHILANIGANPSLDAPMAGPAWQPWRLVCSRP